MEQVLIFFLFIVGIFLVIKGGDWFVESAVWFGKVTGIPNVVIGATIVSSATTLPELLVSTMAARQQYYDVAIGNAVGSIICNMGLILGVMAILSPPQLLKRSFYIKGFFMLSSILTLIYFFTDLRISKPEGLALLVGYILFILSNLWEAFKSYRDREESFTSEEGVLTKKFIRRILFRFVFGVIFIILGARLLVDNGVAIATLLGVPQQIISLTLLALGTSLPELVTGITAIIKKEYGLSIGNILGANILNALLVLGLSAQFSLDGLVISQQVISISSRVLNISQTLYFDLPIAIILSLVLLLGGLLFKQINRNIGILLLVLYIGYISAMMKLFV